MAGYQFQNNGGYVGTAPGTPTMQGADGSVTQVVNEVDDKYWGSCQWVTGQTTADSVFGAAGSTAIPGGQRKMTLVDNNLPRPLDSGLPQAFAQDIYAIAVQFRRAMRAAATDPTLADFSDPVSEPTMFDLNRKTYWEVRYSNRIFCQGVAENFPAGAGQYWQGSASSREVVNNGVPMPSARASMAFPICLREGIQFTMIGTPQAALTINQPASDSGTNLTFVDQVCSLYGPIQKGI